MTIDLYVDTSRKGISMAVATGGQPMNARTMDESARVYEEIVNTEARGEILGESLDTLLTRVGATLDDVKRVMVTLGPGSFSGLRTGVAFCQGLCFSGKRELYGVTTLQALACFAHEAAGNKPAGIVADKECAEIAVVIRARTGFWYMRLNGEEFFIETPEVVERIKNAKVKAIVADAPAQEDEALKAAFAEIGASVSPDTGKPLDMWAPLFSTVKPSLIQEANYIQPSYFEKLKS
ncbi:tRNA (adenosine(37)-N6)-threonylcarbamoyltransferase complex dimerization subunit type 1 TsaB [Fibrobacter sp.]|uniref:tRNA (adenosine(37)-N6)-threonylcarbamoyltransferase complex dimerization subunit type 1 TsaB n=1 Tax=Fibrobacter sp. TaxID=35828 RepID=UPI0025C576CD|nr:tRNA (adenosine(37)-N6)-threonylcarbamoyltransferase complex dimerization subunit type 1 TsaB [Fibrobacter sp.]MBR4006843.1 tRNA (adenosine(37)-N6)-threonylcarbamoyltransferase complex dimerization subunit type 1 TsaB [Fibrobacter sp.]